MTEEPRVSEIVGVKYEDSFWRGEILEKRGDYYVTMLLDRGIKCKSPLKHLWSLSEDLKTVSIHFMRK